MNFEAKLGWLRHWVPALLWACVIFVFSTDLFSGEATSRFILPFLRSMLPHALPETLLQLHFLIRKGAHFANYFVLSLCVLHGIRSARVGVRAAWCLMAVLICAAYAASDELHQAFTATRGASLHDVVLDSSGALVAQLMVLLRAWTRGRIQRW